MTDRAYIISRTLENKIAIAENNDQNTLLVTLDVLKEILSLLKEQEAVVRCKDCEFYPNGNGTTKWLPCKNIIVPPRWFCADGIPKEDQGEHDEEKTYNQNASQAAG